jgi:hypothetical protein
MNNILGNQNNNLICNNLEKYLGLNLSKNIKDAYLMGTSHIRVVGWKKETKKMNVIDVLPIQEWI